MGSLKALEWILGFTLIRRELAALSRQWRAHPSPTARVRVHHIGALAHWLTGRAQLCTTLVHWLTGSLAGLAMLVSTH